LIALLAPVDSPSGIWEHGDVPFSSARTLRLERRLTPADRAASDYLMLPFEVPAGTARLAVRYAYDGQQVAGSGNEIDLGLVDPRGADFPEFPGFRGWSGNARRSAVISPKVATPGYLPGPMTAGTWQVLLGLYKLRAEGCRILVEVSMPAKEEEEEGEEEEPLGAKQVQAPARRPGSGQAAGGGRRQWLRGDLHAHTHHSDAPGSLDGLVAAAHSAGLDFLAVTEHNTVSHLPFLTSGSEPVLIPGVEVTTYYGHTNVWGVKSMIDFRCRTAEQMRCLLELAHGRHLVASANHPYATGMPWTFGFDLPLDAIEVWHGPMVAETEATLRTWDDLLRRGRRLVAVGGSDTHWGESVAAQRLAQPTTWVLAEVRSVESVLEAIGRGRVTMAERGAPCPELTASRDGGRWTVGDQVPPGGPVRISCEGVPAGVEVVLKTAQGPIDGSAVDLGAHRYVRAEFRRRRDGSLVAMTNPIFAAG